MIVCVWRWPLSEPLPVQSVGADHEYQQRGSPAMLGEGQSVRDDGLSSVIQDRRCSGAIA